MPQKTFNVKFSKTNDSGHVQVIVSAYPFNADMLIGSDWIHCSVFNWLRKILPENKTTKGKVTITFEEKP